MVDLRWLHFAKVAALVRSLPSLSATADRDVLDLPSPLLPALHSLIQHFRVRFRINDS
jgi:hypothetical protein